MCPKTHYRYRPHTMLSNHSRLLEAKCILSMSFQSAETAICLDCFIKMRRPKLLKPVVFHGLKDCHSRMMSTAPVKTTPCDLCGQNFIIEGRALNCPNCFVAYFNIVAETRKLGYNPDHITRFHYNIIYDYITLLSVSQRTILNDDGISDFMNRLSIE